MCCTLVALLLGLMNSLCYVRSLPSLKWLVLRTWKIGLIYFRNSGSANDLGNTHFKSGILSLGCTPESSGEALRGKKTPSIQVNQPGINISKAPPVIPIRRGVRLRITALNQDRNNRVSQDTRQMIIFHNRFLKTVLINLPIVLPSWVNCYCSAFNPQMEIIRVIQAVPE